MISLANIYHQAGFLHSALAVGSKALEISPDSVVATHFTLANIFASMVVVSNNFWHYWSLMRVLRGTIRRRSTFIILLLPFNPISKLPRIEYFTLFVRRRIFIEYNYLSKMFFYVKIFYNFRLFSLIIRCS